MVNSTQNTERSLLRVTEVAKRLGVSRTKVYLMMEAGELGYVKFGKCRRVRPEAVEKLIEAGSVG